MHGSQLCVFDLLYSGMMMLQGNTCAVGNSDINIVITGRPHCGIQWINTTMIPCAWFSVVCVRLTVFCHHDDTAG